MSSEALSCAAEPFVVLGVGSNLRREASIAAAVRALLALGQPLWVSRFAETSAEGMVDGSGAFLNGAIGLRSALSPEALKAYLVETEIAAGRDRSHPQRSVRARPLDLDIELRVPPGGSPQPRRFPPYVAPFVADVLSLAGFGGSAASVGGWPIPLGEGLVIGERPMVLWGAP